MVKRSLLIQQKQIMKGLNDSAKVNLQNILSSLNLKEYEGFGGESKSGPYKCNRDKLHNYVYRILITSIESGNESNDSHGSGVQVIIPSNKIDVYTRLEVSLGLKLSSKAAILTEANNLIDELNKRSGIHNEQQYRNAPEKDIS